jgi:hypothetical protein
MSPLTEPLSIVIEGAVAFASTNDGVTTKQVLQVRILGDESDDLDVGAHGRSPGQTFFVQHEPAAPRRSAYAMLMNRIRDRLLRQR